MLKWACFHAITSFSLCNECTPQAVIGPRGDARVPTAYVKVRSGRIRFFLSPSVELSHQHAKEVEMLLLLGIEIIGNLASFSF